ncbi:hypothetical protein AB4144_23720, partial [Rhizobiaceae sp. 2RAB30]
MSAYQFVWSLVLAPVTSRADALAAKAMCAYFVENRSGGMKAILSSVVMLAFASAAALAQGEIPKGWFLHDDQSPTLTLAYYDPVSGDVDISLNCTAGYPDVVVAFYPKSAGMSEGQETKLELRN